MALFAAALFVRFLLEPLSGYVGKQFYKKTFQQTFLYQIMAEIKSKGELLLLLAACAILVESIVPPLVSVSKDAVHRTVKALLSLIFVGAITHSGFKLKDQLMKEELWKTEITAGSVVS